MRKLPKPTTAGRLRGPHPPKIPPIGRWILRGWDERRDGNAAEGGRDSQGPRDTVGWSTGSSCRSTGQSHAQPTLYRPPRTRGRLTGELRVQVVAVVAAKERNSTAAAVGAVATANGTRRQPRLRIPGQGLRLGNGLRRRREHTPRDPGSQAEAVLAAVEQQTCRRRRRSGGGCGCGSSGGNSWRSGNVNRGSRRWRRPCTTPGSQLLGAAAADRGVSGLVLLGLAAAFEQPTEKRRRVLLGRAPGRVRRWRRGLLLLLWVIAVAGAAFARAAAVGRWLVSSRPRRLARLRLGGHKRGGRATPGRQVLLLLLILETLGEQGEAPAAPWARGGRRPRRGGVGRPSLEAFRLERSLC